MRERERGAVFKGWCVGVGKGAPEAAAASVPGTDSGGAAAVRGEERARAGRRLGLWPSRRAGGFF